ncbi:hypothetical protein EASAB2608_00244 [Streptomyces sp. EAS-AB2608]|nr:hypothetical protein EASAB2608_00244 [Streptomyces sp. EAS-AB2608]
MVRTRVPRTEQTRTRLADDEDPHGAYGVVPADNRYSQWRRIRCGARRVNEALARPMAAPAATSLG